MAKAWIGSLVGHSSSPGAVRTPQCHDVITAVGGEPFAPWGEGGGHLSVTQTHPQWDFKMLCSPWLPPHSRGGLIHTVDVYLGKSVNLR